MKLSTNDKVIRFVHVIWKNIFNVNIFPSIIEIKDEIDQPLHDMEINIHDEIRNALIEDL